MKTAISVPDETFEKATRRARELGMSRSEFFSRAAAHYLDEVDTDLTTDRINAALVAQTESDESAAAATAAGRRTLQADDDDW